MKGKRYKKYKINKKKFITRILLLLIIIFVIIKMFQGIFSGEKKEEIKTNDIQNTEAQIVDDSKTEDNSEEIKKDSEDVAVVEIKEEKPKKIDFLSNLSVPVYKKSEKDIQIPILIYHAFCTPIPDDDEYNLFSSAEKFEENVTALLEDGYTFITLEDLYRYNKGEIGLPEKVIIITMDDGWFGCYTDAYAILEKYNIPGTIFIVNKLMGKEGYIDWDMAKEMYDSGLVKIHCHGYNHINYANEDKDTLISDYTKSHNEIEEHLGEKIQKIMAYPAGKSSENSIKWLKEIGFEVQVQTKYGTVNKSKNLDLTDLGRIRAEKATGKRLIATINSGGI